MGALPTDVLACLDLSSASATVLDEATALAIALGARLHLLHVAAPESTLAGYDRPGGINDRDRRAGELSDEHRRLHELAASVETIEVVPLLVMGVTADTILAEADRLDSALVVVGSHGHGALHRLLVGSTTDALLRRSTRPLVVVPVATGTTRDGA